MATAQPDKKIEWHLRKEIPITMFVVLAIEGLALVYLAGQASNRLKVLENSMSIHVVKDAHEGQARATAQIQADLRNIKESLSEVKSDVKDIRRKVD